MAKKIKKTKKAGKKQLFIDVGFFSPKNIKAKYQEYNSPYIAHQIYAAYIIALVATLAVSYMFSFTIVNVIVTGVAFFLTTPIVLISMQKYRYEAKKFMDINSYMQQFAQGMKRTEKIASSLADTLIVFKEGEMKDTIQKAVDHINYSWDAKISKVEALSFIEEKYGNKQLVMLHDFSLRAEEHGGDFKKELQLLSEMRDKWQKRTDAYQLKLKSTVITTIVGYIALMCLCAYILQEIPEIMDVKYLPAIQTIEVLYVIGFCVVIIILQNKRCSSLLNETREMSLEEAEEAMDYVENFDRKKNGKKYRPMGLACILIFAALALTTKSIATFIFGLVAGSTFLNLHNIIYVFTKKQIRDEMTNEFPKWLFDLCLLMQRDTIINAISKSLFTAPPIMRRDIRKLEERLAYDPTNRYAFLDFLEEYEMNEVVNTMRSLVSMKEGNMSNNKEQMRELISYNLNLIEEREVQQFEVANAKSRIYMFLPFIFTIVVIVVYFIAIFVVTFEYSMSII